LGKNDQDTSGKIHTTSMKTYLNQKQVDYILYHLEILIELNDRIRSEIVFLRSPYDLGDYKNKIIFFLSDQNLSLDRIKWIDNVPVLFPLGDSTNYCHIEDGNVIFSDDLLKSAFYLLSGYQEHQSKEKDKYGRYPYSSSIQERLNIVGKPVVNYYFREIINGINVYCNSHNIPFTEKRAFVPFGFLLTHDIDRIDKYKWSYIGYKIKELIGLVTRQKSWFRTLFLFLRALAGSVKLLKNNNPYWSFEYIINLNKKFGFHSTYFFLSRNQKYVDADFDLDDKRLLKLYNKLLERGDEIGVHGTVASSYSEDKAVEDKNIMEEILGKKVNGIRQHRLCYESPVTSVIQDKLGYIYDTTLGFAERIGFRNSYCLPFKLYNFEKEEMFNQWHIPLNVMDITLFAYQNYNIFAAEKAIKAIVEEVRKFNGVFTLLWHNLFLDEDEFKGIRDFYYRVLEYLANQNCISLTGSAAIKHFTTQSEIQY